ncbi:uncharacterized protein LOC143863716 [Tasmannia lanceolata]|uniref:uncharacterized protein LOC143863716 n=1 Tax=Tasmannia lanceolata TaxID=3420 RepID=UPI0040628E93
MPGLTQKNASSQLSAVGSVQANGIWSNQGGDVTFDQLQKFWSELSPHARQELLRIDKQTLFEQARKNLYCSRCNGLLLEGFSQIVMYGKSLQREGAGEHLPSKPGALKKQIDNGSNIMPSSCQDDTQDPSINPWGCLATTRDGILTLLDCFLYGKSLNALQNVFDNARARERERELLYPDACGGGGRGWISQGMTNYGRGHGTKETCALHTARLSCDTLVDFLSALGDETRHSLLRMKEEDFIERLMYRFDSERFCRDCRRNVIREFKELKELKRMRREPCCTNWFCVADTAFQYEVSSDTVLADWNQSFTDMVGSYHHFEWAVGTGEGESDILEFEDVGMNGNARVNGLDLGGLSLCFITLRAWKLDGRCTEFSVKAHALKGQSCVHRRLIVGDGFVTITIGESIKRFFEHAEEAEEEEDDDSMDKDGSEVDGEGSFPQKHAKSPELAREFLLDAAAIIFKEQVEKAFREVKARQNAHSIFVCLALKLLEERVHVACKEIITLQKQIKLLEEEEREKRYEEERKERRRMKEREKKLRRKERLKGKERERGGKCIESKQLSTASQLSTNESILSAHEDPHNTSKSGDSLNETDDIMLSNPNSSEFIDEESSNECIESKQQNSKNDSPHHPCKVGGELSVRDGHGSFMTEQSKSYQKFHGCMTSFRCIDELHRQAKNNATKSNTNYTRNCGLKFHEKSHSSNNRTRDRQHVCMIRSGRDLKISNKSDYAVDMSRSIYHSNTNQFNHGCYTQHSCAFPKGKLVRGNFPPVKGPVLHIKKVWEPMRKKCTKSNSDTDGTENGSQQPENCLRAFDEQCSSEFSGNSGKGDALNNYESHVDSMKKSCNYSPGERNDCRNGFGLGTKSNYFSKDVADNKVGLSHVISTLNGDHFSDPLVGTSRSDNCSSCLSEGNNSTGSSGAQNAESSSISYSEDASQQSEGREITTSGENAFPDCLDVGADGEYERNGREFSTNTTTTGFLVSNCIGVEFPCDQPTKNAHNSDNGKATIDMGSQQHHPLAMQNQSIHLPVVPAPLAMGYYHHSPPSWAATPTNGSMQFSQPNHYLFTSPYGYGAIQPLTTPILNFGQLPLYQTTNKAYGMNSKDQTRTCKLGGAQEATGVAARAVSEHPLESRPPNQQHVKEGPSPGQGGPIGVPAKYHNDGPNFSLFHFGGPGALLLNDGVIGDFSSKSPAASVQVNLACSKKVTNVGEYSLFSASTGDRFSFF